MTTDLTVPTSGKFEEKVIGLALSSFLCFG
jgi:hypothetical protein